jgi:predicted nucleic acid-binding protein
MQDGITFDTGVLIALEKGQRRAHKLLWGAEIRRIRVVVPSPVVAEWWRGRTDRREAIKRSVRIEPLSERVAEMAGEALASVRGATVVDAIVMASAATRGDVVFTSDVEDLERLRPRFPSVRVLGL